jgi:sulfhydrogenase subunit beta (sulfur reductase)
MSLRIIQKEEMAAFVASMQSGYRIVGPLARGKHFAFGEISDPKKLRLDYNTTILPPKKVLQPPEERLMTFRRTGQPVADVALEAPPTVLLGVHTCDLHGIKVLDQAFSQGYPDAHYLARRKNTLLVSIECLEPCDEHSFCKSMDTMTATDGYDLHLTDLGQAYAVDIGSAKGATLLEEHSQAREATEADMRQLNNVLGAKWPRFAYKLDLDAGELASLMRQSYDSPEWQILGDKCLACGQCTLVCPTCFCFNVYDQVALDLEEGERWRRWDSCQLDEFARVAGGENFREQRAARLRHRFMRKGRYLEEKYGELGCTGCGRCARSCLVDISPVEVFNDLYRTRSGGSQCEEV